MRIEHSRAKEAITELVKYVKECLEIGGLPMIRTEYAGIPFKYTKDTTPYRGIIVLCYGRAEYLPSINLSAPDKGEWKELVDEFSRYAGDYRIVLYKYGDLITREEVERELERKFGRKLVEELRSRPLIPVVK